MKATRYILSSLVLISGITADAQYVEPDTLTHITENTKVIVTENPEGTKIEVRNFEDGHLLSRVTTEYSTNSKVKSTSSEGIFDEIFRNRNFLDIEDKGSDPWGVSVDGVCLGLTKACSQSPADGLQWSKSFEISWLSILNVYYEFSRSRISLGFGLDWRNYKITTSDRFLEANEDKGIEWREYSPGVKGRFSRLKVFSLQVPLLYSYDVPDSRIGFKAGPILDFNTYASLKTVWDDENGNRMESFTKAIEPRRVTVDFYASISWSNAIGIYVRYSPMKVMDAPQTLNFQPLTLGLTIGI